MKIRTIETPADLQKASQDLAALGEHIPFVLTITQGRHLRSSAANSRYWCSLKDALDRINEDVNAVSEYTGYSNLEARKIIAKSLPWEQSMMLCVRTTEAMHEVAKMIVGIPTSTKLGSKEFHRFEQRIEQVISEIVGEIRTASQEPLIMWL